MGRSQKKVKSLIEVPYVAQLKVQVLGYLDRVIYFRGNMIDQVNGHSPKKLKLLIEVPNEAYLKVDIFSYNMILISSP